MKKTFTVSDFRKVLEQMIHGDKIHFSRSKNGGFWEILDKMEQTSDDDLLEANLSTDLGMDSIDVWEMICTFEHSFDVCVADAVEKDFSAEAELTVRRFLEAVNANQE